MPPSSHVRGRSSAAESIAGSPFDGEIHEMLTIILILLLVLALGGGGWGHSRWGYAGWSPAGVILLVLLLLWLTGNLHFR